MDIARRKALEAQQLAWLQSFVLPGRSHPYRALKPRSIATVRTKYSTGVVRVMRFAFPMFLTRWSPSVGVLVDLFRGVEVPFEPRASIELVFGVLAEHARTMRRAAAWHDLLAIERAFALAGRGTRARKTHRAIERTVLGLQLAAGEHRERDSIYYLGLGTNLIAQFPRLDPRTARARRGGPVTAAVFRDRATGEVTAIV